MNLSKQSTAKYQENLKANIDAINKVASTVRPTVGPKGLDVMLVDQYGEYTCTNDGVEILSNIDVNHPAAKLAIEVAKAQELKVGDGTTTATILTDAILQNALHEIENNNYSPVRLVKGIDLAIDFITKSLEDNAEQIIDINDPKLKSITNISARANEAITDLLVEVAKKEITNNSMHKDFQLTEDFSNCVKGFQAHGSRVIDGILINKKSHFEFNTKLKDASILVIEGAFEPDPIPAEAVTTDAGVKKFENNIYALQELAKKVLRSGIKVILVDASMLPSLEEFFSKEGILVLTRIKKSELKEIARVSGTQLLSKQAIASMDFGEIQKSAGLLKSFYRDQKLNAFILEGSKYYRATALISAETRSALQEKERIAIDAAKALRSAYQYGYVLGEGVAEINLQQSLRDYIHEYQKENSINDRALIAGMETVANSLPALFEQILENAGFAADEFIKQAKLGLNNKEGLDLDTGNQVDLDAAGILDPVEVKINAFKIAAEIVCQILRINLVLQSK